MKKVAIIALSVLLCLGAFAATAGAVTVDEEHDLIYYLWDSSLVEGDNRSNNTPTNQVGIEFAEIAATSAMKLTYQPNDAGKDPYYSFRAVALDEYKYCSIAYYYDTPDETQTVGGRFWYLDATTEKWAFMDFDYQPNRWTMQVLSFKEGETGFSGDEWQATGTPCSWFRLNVNLTENYDALYIRSIAFFKTKEEAEKFAGFADARAYLELRQQALTLSADRYENFDAVTAALENDASDVFFAVDQARLDEAYQQLKTAMDSLKIKAEHGQAKEPSVDVIKVNGIYPSAQGESTTPPTVTEQATEAESANSGCGALVNMGAGMGILAATAGFALLFKKKKDKR